MNKTFGLISVFSLALLFVGCTQHSEKISGSKQSEKQEVWDGTPPTQEAIPVFFADAPEINSFPDSIVGLWEAELLVPAVKWDIRFEPDGSIKRIHHTIAEDVNIEEGGTDANGLEGSYWTFVMGPCEARYIPDTNTLKVKIIVDYFFMKIPFGEREGRMEDYFEGPILADGTWGTQWRSFIWVKGAPPPPIDELKANPEPLIFVKIDPNNPPEQTPLQ